MAQAISVQDGIARTCSSVALWCCCAIVSHDSPWDEVGFRGQFVGGRLANYFEGTPSTSHGMASCVGPVCCQVSRAEVSQPPHLRHASKPPEKAAADAVEEIERLKVAISALGRVVDALKTSARSLRAAKVRASMPPIQERGILASSFLEGAKKRVHRAQEVIDRAHEQKAVYETEVAEGEARLAKLMAEAAIAQTPPVVLPQVPPPTVIPNDAQGTWMGGGPPRFEDIPPTGWMRQRNSELRNAIEFGDPVLVVKIGGLIGQGAALLSSIGRNLPDMTRQPDLSDDEIRSRSAPGEGRFAPH